jgi:NAD(P)H-hydrate epimerase
VADLARADGVREVEPNGPWPDVGLVLDAILGTGAKGPLRPAVAELVARIADFRGPLVAVDGPTGLDLETGVSHEGVRADLTITFGGYRRGHLLARDEVGDLCVIDIGLACPASDWPTLFESRLGARAVGPLPSRSHKGGRGRVVVVGGHPGMVGAARLAARAAFAGGAGLVHVIAPEAAIATIATAEPDVQVTISSFERLSAEAGALLARADAVIVGPGLGRGPGRAEFIAHVAESCRAPLVIDADGLMAFGGAATRLRDVTRGRAIVLTPHAGEFRALFPAEAADIAVDPWGGALAAATVVDNVVLLKGVPTVVAAPGQPPLTIAAGNPGLATGGSGDTLSGLIAAWLGQGVEPTQAAGAAAQALGDAADVAARRHSARGVRPMDVIAALPDVWRRWDQERRDPAPAVAPIRHELAAPIRV